MKNKINLDQVEKFQIEELEERLEMTADPGWTNDVDGDGEEGDGGFRHD